MLLFIILHIDQTPNLALCSCNDAVFPPRDAIVPQLSGTVKNEKIKIKKHTAHTSGPSDAFGQFVASYILFTHLRICEAKSMHLEPLLSSFATSGGDRRCRDAVLCVFLRGHT